MAFLSLQVLQKEPKHASLGQLNGSFNFKSVSPWTMLVLDEGEVNLAVGSLLPHRKAHPRESPAQFLAFRLSSQLVKAHQPFYLNLLPLKSHKYRMQLGLFKQIYVLINFIFKNIVEGQYLLSSALPNYLLLSQLGNFCQ